MKRRAGKMFFSGVLAMLLATLAFPIATLANAENRSDVVTIIYDANGGFGAPQPHTVPITAEGAVITTASGVPAKPGYWFANWDWVDGTGVHRRSRAADTRRISDWEYERHGGEVTMVARWIPHSQMHTFGTWTFDIYYDARGGVGAPSNRSIPFLPGVLMPYQVSQTMPHREGYIFSHWAYFDSLGQRYVNSGAWMQVGPWTSAGNQVTFHAVWLPISDFSPHSILARPTASTVIVNGDKVPFLAYNIGGYNFFRLRDIAYVLGGTSAQFSVGWDGAANVITLVSGEAYQSTGNELGGHRIGIATATPTDSSVFLNGQRVNFGAFNIGGYNFFRLRDLATVLGFEVEWIAETSTILIDAPCASYIPTPDPICTNHDFDSRGFCVTCGIEYQFTITPMSATLYTAYDGATVRARPYLSDATLRMLPLGAAVSVNGFTINADGTRWYRLVDGGWIFSENLARTNPITPTCTTHVFNLGICTICGDIFQMQTNRTTDRIYIITDSHSHLRPYRNAPVSGNFPSGMSIQSNTPGIAHGLNSLGESWFELHRDSWVYGGNISFVDPRPQLPQQQLPQQPSDPFSISHLTRLGYSHSQMQNILEQEVIRLVNEIRAEHGLPALIVHTELSRLARHRAQELVYYGWLPNHVSHTTGLSGAAHLRAMGLNAQWAGENQGAMHLSPQEVVNSWMNSTVGHRDFILSVHPTSRFSANRYIGVGVSFQAGGVFTRDINWTLWQMR